MDIEYNKDNSNKVINWLIGVSLTWVLFIILAPMFKSSNDQLLIWLSEYLYFLFEPVCHQLPERSILLNSEPMAVCARCFSIYSGGLIILIYTIWKKHRLNLNIYAVVGLCIPAILDFILGKIGLYSDTLLLRILTGLPLGAGIMFLIVISISDNNNFNLSKWNIDHGKSEIN